MVLDQVLACEGSLWLTGPVGWSGAPVLKYNAEEDHDG